MTKEQVIEELCNLLNYVYETFGDYSHASDCFCHKNPNNLTDNPHFCHDGKTLEYVKEAVVGRLRKDGFKV